MNLRAEERIPDRSSTESIGGAIDVFSGNNSFGCALNLRSKDFKLGLDILADIIQRPTFDTEEFERQRREIIAEIKCPWRPYL